jgi:uncharacterized damage-inducible protein DinB
MVDRRRDWMGSERSVLVHYLDKMRDAVVRTSSGLTEDDARMPGVPSGTSLLGIVHHLTEVEAHWFRRVFAGEDIELEMSMDVPVGAGRDDVVAAYRAECARSNEIVHACPDLGALAAIANPGEDEIAPLRVIVTHMIEETARHAGHADILREQIDGVTND